MFYKTFLHIFSDFCSGCSGNVRSFEHKTITKTKKNGSTNEKTSHFVGLIIDNFFFDKCSEIMRCETCSIKSLKMFIQKIMF